jgi:hypothetical protein
MLDNWNASIKGMTLRHPDPSVRVSLSVVNRGRHTKILFTLNGLTNSQTSERMFVFEYYFYVTDWPGLEKARLWILANWALLMEHEALELAQLDGAQMADPHTSDWCEAHRTALDRRHDMNYMLSRICG